jgi:hypothetical protein
MKNAKAPLRYKFMLEMSPESEALADEYTTKLARLMFEHTEPEKLKDFESMEVEIRDQIIKRIAPKIGEFFFSEGGKKCSGKKRKIKSMVGEVEISQKQAKKLGLSPKIPLSPAFKKACLRLCAKSSYQQAEEDMSELLGFKVGHSTLHRLVQRTELPLAQPETTPITGVSIDGGKICLRGEEGKGGQWRDYKLVSCHDNICEAFFQAPESLKEWSNGLSLAPMVTFLGDGHQGVWNLVQDFAPEQWLIRREVLDWYHLKENLHKAGGSLKRLKDAENLLWHGFIDAASRQFDGLKNKKFPKFQSYLAKHRERIPSYETYQKLGIPIGSGDVESKIKQVGARVKLSGARWNRENVPRILRLRCAYLNRSPHLSINVLP